MGNRTLVLVVEDDPLLRRSLARGLRTSGYLVAPAGSAAEAEPAMCNERAPDFAVVDYQLPDGTGPDVLEALRSYAPNATPAG